jgi:hypothetical protein
MLYYILAILIFFYAIYDISTEGNVKLARKLLSRCSLFFLLSLCIILSGIRWETGTDWLPYYTYFSENNTWAEYKGYKNGQFEILYALLNYLVKLIAGSYTVFLFVLAMLVILLKYASIEKIARYPALTFFLFYCFYIGDIFPVRQTLAVSVLLTSIYFIHKKRKLPFVMLVVIAASFHLSSVLWIFSYYVYHKKFSNISIILFLGLSFVMGLFGSGIYIHILKTMSQFPGNFGKAFGRIIVYLTGQYDDGSYSILRNILALVKRMIMIPVFLMFRKKMCIYSYYANGLLNLYLFGSIFYLIFAMNMNFAPLQRMSVPFILLEIFLLPIILIIIKSKYMKFIYLNLLLLYGLSKLYSVLNAYYDVYIPYKSILG